MAKKSLSCGILHMYLKIQGDPRNPAVVLWFATFYCSCPQTKQDPLMQYIMAFRT